MNYNLLKNDPINIYLKFTKLKVSVVSLLLDDTGVFERFCFKAILNNLSKEEISEITNLRIDIVEERINFLISHRFIEELENSYRFTPKGNKIIEHIKIAEHFENNFLFLAIDKFGKQIFSFEQLSNYFVKRNDNFTLLQEKVTNYKIEFENELREEIEKKAWDSILPNYPSVNKDELSIIYDCLGNYFLPLELNFKDISFLKSSQNEKENLYIPCIENKVIINFPELENLDIQEKMLLENFEGKHVPIIEKLKQMYLVKEKEEKYVLTESGEVISDLIKWDKEYSRNPMIICSDSLWGNNISGQNLLSKISDSNKILKPEIKFDNEDLSLNENIIPNLLIEKQLTLPATLIDHKYSFNREIKYFPISVTSKWLKNKIYKAANIPCEICKDKRLIKCEKCSGKKEIQPFKKCSCLEGWNKCSCNNGTKDCLYCSGKGKTIICNSCQGSNICSKCNGKYKNWEICYNCTGTGKVYFFFDCTVCKGSKQYLPPNCTLCDGKLTCSACKGNSFRICSNCEGIGKVKCFTCRETGKLECRFCRGIGHFPQILCSVCNEDGSISCSECFFNHGN